MINTLKVRFAVVGFHHWPEATAGRQYLAQPHRHRFQFQCETNVTDLNRQVEFHDLLRDCKFLLAERFDATSELNFQFNNFSCEQIAMEMLLGSNGEEWELSAVEVWEDGECGARVERSEAPLSIIPLEVNDIPF